MSNYLVNACSRITGFERPGPYRLIRFWVGLGSALAFGTWSQGSGPGRVLGVHYANKLDVGTGYWWAVLLLGYIAAVALMLNVGGRVTAGLVFLGLQACGGFMLNWAGLALQTSSLALVFVSGDGENTPWPRRFLQLQLPLGYVSAVVAKLTLSDHWRALHAFDHLLAHPMNRYTWPRIPTGAAALFDLAGMTLEIGAGVFLLTYLITKKPWSRHVGLGMSIVLHVGISLLIPVGLFLFGMAPFWASFTKDRSVPGWLKICAVIGSFAVLCYGILGPSNPFSPV